MLIDLHLHTRRSDGTSEPLELLNYIGFQHPEIVAVSITDHDTVCAYEDIEGKETEFSFRIIKGVEFSASSNGVETHVLGYNINTKDADLLRYLEQLRLRRLERNLKILEKLKEAKIYIDPKILTDKKGTTGRMNVARALLKQRVVNTAGEAFRLYLDSGTPTYVADQKPDAAEVIDVIHSAGGVAVLAHAYKIKTDEKIEDLVARFYKMGIDGLECRYHSFDHNQTNTLLALADKYNLIKTGGSDLHDLNRTIGVNVDELPPL